MPVKEATAIPDENKQRKRLDSHQLGDGVLSVLFFVVGALSLLVLALFFLRL